MDILGKLVASTRERVERDKKNKPGFGKPVRGPLEGFAFEKELRKKGMSFICEIKKASPSKGVIAREFSHLDIACTYEASGADAISVLTEPEHFLGSDSYLKEIRNSVDIPLLRKDFIVDPYQIAQSRFLGADGILLIAAILSPAQLHEFIHTADEYGLSCLVEVHDEYEMRTALDAKARLIGVNNRDLRTFAVDINNSITLRRMAPENVIFVAESGIRTAEDIAALRDSEIDGVLVGEALMCAEDKASKLKALRGDRV